MPSGYRDQSATNALAAGAGLVDLVEMQELLAGHTAQGSYQASLGLLLSMVAVGLGVPAQQI